MGIGGMKYGRLMNLGMDTVQGECSGGMPVTGGLSDSSPGRVKVKAGASFENKHQNKCLWSLPLQKTAWTVVVEARSEKENINHYT